MPIRIVRLGSPRKAGEGVRFGTVRRLPRGVPKTRYAADDWFDVWLPNLAPSADKKYEREMARPEVSRVLDALAALSTSTNFSVGCYCENERRCHRSILARILERHGAEVQS
jgi:uncharacterized protein YeaO (DUF488 family)